MNAFDVSIKIEIPTPPTSEPESYCRFCYSTTGDLRPLFPTTGDAQQQRIIELLDQLIGIKISMLDDVPSAICGQCLCKLEDFDLFRRKCVIYSDEVVRAVRFHWEMCPASDALCVKIDPFPESDSVNREPGDAYSGATSKVDRKSELTVPLAYANNSTCVDDGNATAREFIAKAPMDVIEPIKSKTQRFSQIKSGRTGPLMEKLNKLRGIKSKKLRSQSSEKRDYRCKVCMKFFTDKNSISIHMRTHMDTVNVRCLHCSRKFDTVQGLLGHGIRNYVLTSFSCHHCDVLFKTKEQLITHELYCEQDLSKYQTIETVKAHPCNQCSKSFDSIYTLQNHMLCHNPNLVCDKCGADFQWEFKLKNHYERYHSKGPDRIDSIVKCDLCDRTFVDASAYRSHHTACHQDEQNQQLRKLDEDKLYECDHCGKRFWSINTIRYHVLVHRQYRDCDQCSGSFRSPQELRDHKLAAHPVQCPFCPKTFFSRMSCRSHCSKKHGMVQIKMLADDKRTVTYEWRQLVFKCASCEQDYEFYWELKDHYSKMHPGLKALIKCSYCERQNSSSRIGFLSHVTGNCGQTPRKVKAWH